MKKTLSQQVAEIGEKLTFEDLPDYVVENSFQILYLIFDYPHKHHTFKHFEV